MAQIGSFTRGENGVYTGEIRTLTLRGKAATARAIALLKGREIAFERVGRSYDRTVARVWLGDRDLAALLVAAGAARWWPRGEARPSWCEAARR